MTFDEWWKNNGIEMATYAEKSAARKGFEAGAVAEREACADLCDEVRSDRDDALARASADMCAVLIRKRSSTP